MDTKSIISQIGNTPLVRLKQASELTDCNIYGKAEYFNPGESVKDRAALFIVKNALKKQLISKGGTIVEGTAGNTGIGLAIVCKEYELKFKVVDNSLQGFVDGKLMIEVEDTSDPFTEGMIGFLTENGAIQSKSISIE